MSLGYVPYVTSHDYSQDYFTMIVTTGGGNVTWTGNSAAPNAALSYSTDNGANWTEANSSITLSVVTGDKVLWKGITTSGTSSFDPGIGQFSGDTNVRYSVEGNVMSLIYGDDFKGQTSLEGKNYALSKLFNSNKNITSAENLSLPATTLADSCYRSMFNSCTSLTTAPELPATTLTNGCYRMMFQGCTSLTTAPELSATTLADSCYFQMFFNCTSLTTAPELPATTLADGCYGNMFSGCTSLTTAPELPVTTLVGSCYSGMFNGCSSLMIAPELPATTLADWCYSGMFTNCSSLTTAPELPATTLVDSCYQNMFYKCTSLNHITCLATDISASNCTADWVKNVPAGGTFTKAVGMTSWTEGTSGIPAGWTVQDAA